MVFLLSPPLPVGHHKLKHSSDSAAKCTALVVGKDIAKRIMTGWRPSDSYPDFDGNKIQCFANRHRCRTAALQSERRRSALESQDQCADVINYESMKVSLQSILYTLA